MQKIPGECQQSRNVCEGQGYHYLSRFTIVSLFRSHSMHEWTGIFFNWETRRADEPLMGYVHRRPQTFATPEELCVASFMTLDLKSLVTLIHWLFYSTNLNTIFSFGKNLWCLQWRVPTAELALSLSLCY